MLFYIYSNAPGTTIDITSRCRVGRLSVKDNAEEGSVAISSLIIDDPAGDLEITGHRRMYIYESEAPILDQVVFNGFVVNERVERGPYRTGAGRQWVVDLADPNVLINRRIMNGADANRPAENDLERIQALLTMTELNTVDDDTYVNTTAGTTAMDAVDYRGQNVGAYIDDCRQASGKNGYILYNETLAQYGLWYDFDYSTVYDSGCFLTNTIGEADHETYFVYSQERTHLNRDPSRVASGIYLEYDGGTVYVQDAGTTAAFAAIDWAAPSVNVKSLTKATARANRYLDDAASEDDVVHTVLTKVPRRNVNKIKKGQLVSFKASWMTEYTAYSTFRVLYRTVTEISEDPEGSFEIEMDLTPQPTLEPAYAILYEPSYGPATAGVVLWQHDGDDPPGGVAGAPLVGSVHYIDVGTGHTPEYQTNAHISGIGIDEDGIVSVRFHSEFISLGWGPRNYTATIRHNGVIIASEDYFLAGNGAGEWLVTVDDVAVVSGDIIEGWEGSLAGTIFLTPFGSGGGAANYLEVTGQLQA